MLSHIEPPWGPLPRLLDEPPHVHTVTVDGPLRELPLNLKEGSEISQHFLMQADMVVAALSANSLILPRGSQASSKYLTTSSNDTLRLYLASSLRVISTSILCVSVATRMVFAMTLTYQQDIASFVRGVTYDGA